jgi:hypothetical protein
MTLQTAVPAHARPGTLTSLLIQSAMVNLFFILVCGSQCLTCVTSDTNCLSCFASQFRQLASNKCTCKDGYFDNGADICAPCHFSCATCKTTATNCLSCVSADLRTFDGVGSCLCNDSYYDANLPVCASCSYKCLTCTGLPTKCTSCLNNSNRTPDATNFKCDCSPGYYDVSQPICNPCAPSCATCQFTPLYCLSCKADTTTNRLDASAASKTCPCSSGYFDDLVNANCQRNNLILSPSMQPIVLKMRGRCH